MYPSVYLKPKRDLSWRYGHPWIFSQGIVQDASIPPGSLVEVYNDEGQFVGIGTYHFRQTIALRMLTAQKEEINTPWWVKKLQALKEYRNRIVGSETTAYRLSFGESDGLSGLVIDLFEKQAVVEINTLGMSYLLDSIIQALQKMDIVVAAVRSQSVSAQKEQVVCDRIPRLELLWAQENGLAIASIVKGGQKTGWFCDQRDNRLLIKNWVQKNNIESVLNLFSYSGGFSLYALQGGAKKVVNVDSDERALKIFEEMVDRNRFKKECTQSVCCDVWDYLKQEKEEFDLVIVDPPAFAKSEKKKQEALQGYKHLFIAALARLKEGGSILATSCSHFITEEDMQWVWRQVMQASGRRLQTVAHLRQAADHPMPCWFEEALYLKGYLLQS